MNGTRLALSILFLALPAAALPAVRRTRYPRAWALTLSASLGAGFVLFEVSLVHAALPTGLTLLGLDRLAEACRSMGGHLFGGAAPFGIFAGTAAVVIVIRAFRGAALTVRANSQLRDAAAAARRTAIGGAQAALFPLVNRWAVAVPGSTPAVLLSPVLVTTLGSRELDAVVRHELAHLEHRHLRFLLLGTTVNAGLWFLPWRKQANRALQLTLERWADEAASRSSEDRAHVRSAVAKLAELAPSALAGDRVDALGREAEPAHREWGWPSVVSTIVPLALALAITLVLHVMQVVRVAGMA